MAEHSTWIAIAISGVISGYDVLIVADDVTVLRSDQIVARRTVAGLGAFVSRAQDLRLGWACFDAFDVIYVYDRGDQNFGYAINLQVEHYSEWGYAPFSPMETGDE